MNLPCNDCLLNGDCPLPALKWDLESSVFKEDFACEVRDAIERAEKRLRDDVSVRKVSNIMPSMEAWARAHRIYF